MVGYAIVLVSYPAALGAWPPLLDGQTGATALTEFRYRDGLTAAEAFRQNPRFGRFGSYGWEWANLGVRGLAACCCGALRLIAWRVVAGFLVTLCLLALMFNDGGSSAGAGGPLLHLLSGGTLLAACFVITDPVTHPGARPVPMAVRGPSPPPSPFIIRAWGGYPDGIAFAVLLGNAATPLIDRIFRQPQARARNENPT